MLKPGDNIDSWCGKCKMMLAHTIEAVVRNKPARLHCNTCQAQHSYKPYEPGEAPSQVREREAAGRAPAPTPTKGRGNRYLTLLRGKDMAQAKTYSSNARYAPGDVVQHPSFGFGVATAVRDVTKVEVLFESGPKVLIHGR